MPRSRPYDVEVRARRKDGEWIWVHDRAVATYEKDGLRHADGLLSDITERKLAEEEILFKTALLEAQSETTVDGILAVDEADRVLLVNQQFGKMWNLSPETLTEPDDSKMIQNVLPQIKDPDGFLAKVRYLNTHLSELSRDELELRDGRVFDRYSSPLRGRAGKFYGRIWYFRDITERKRATEALRQSEERFRQIAETIDEVFWTTDPAISKMLYISPAYERVWGRSRESLYENPKSFLDTIHIEDRPRVLSALEGQSRGIPFDHEYRVVVGESVRWIWDRGFPVRDEEGNLIRFVGVAVDVTERKQAEAERVRLVTAIEQSAEAVVITNLQGRIEYVNPAFTDITGYTREESLGQNPRILKSEEQDPAFYQELWTTILAGKPWQGELINRRKDGTFYHEQMNIAPVKNARGELTHFIATKEDVTERRAMQAQLQQAAKMEAIGRLAGGVAHDFNNLLTVINGYSEMLLGMVGSHATVTEYLREIHHAGEHAASLTRQLLAFSRRQVLAPQILDLNSSVANLGKMLRRLIGEDIRLRTELSPGLGRVRADPGQIEQVIINLAVNARDAMEKGGDLIIETRNVELDENYANQHSSATPGPHVMLAVSDTGTGMSPETRARIFEPFFTTKGMGKGTGLGLATVYGIVKQSGGNVWVYSELGKGTVFKVYFPLVAEDPNEVAPVGPGTHLSSGTETILMIEDEVGVASLVRVALTAGGYTVLEARDPDTLLKICAQHQGKIDLLLSDVVMPQMSGPTIAEKVSALLPGIKVLFMSGYTDDSIVHHGVMIQNMPFIQKPFTPEGLRRKIRDVLGNKGE